MLVTARIGDEVYRKWTVGSLIGHDIYADQIFRVGNLRIEGRFHAIDTFKRVLTACWRHAAFRMTAMLKTERQFLRRPEPEVHGRLLVLIDAFKA